MSLAAWLFLTAVGFMFLEFSVPGIGVFALASIFCLIFSLYYFMGATTLATYIVLGIITIVLTVIVITFKNYSDSKFWRYFTLRWQSSSDKGYLSSDNYDFLLGKKGQSLTVLRPAGMAKFDEKIYDVVTEGVFLDKSVAVEVVAVEGRRIVVREINKEVK